MARLDVGSGLVELRALSCLLLRFADGVLATPLIFEPLHPRTSEDEWQAGLVESDHLAQRGFAKRSPHSVRNHYIRRLKAQRSCAFTKNMCRKCGQPMRGHVCLVTQMA